jgi:hypothetical protein
MAQRTVDYSSSTMGDDIRRQPADRQNFMQFAKPNNNARVRKLPAMDSHG